MSSIQSSNTKLEIWVSDYVQLCSTDHSLDLAMETDDITDMCSSQYRETSSQIRDISIPINGVFESTSTAYQKLKTRYFATSSTTENSITIGVGQVVAKYTDADGSTYEGALQIKSLSEAANVNQDVRFSLDAAFSGSVTVA